MRDASTLGDAEGVDARGTMDGSMNDGATQFDTRPNVDAAMFVDAGAEDAGTEDANDVRYERDVRPLLEASACGDCHEGGAVTMDYAWISAPGETWCTGMDYGRRWHCVEEHARTQMGSGDDCTSDFYHRHGEPCFTEETRSWVLRWAADGYLP